MIETYAFKQSFFLFIVFCLLWLWFSFIINSYINNSSVTSLPYSQSFLRHIDSPDYYSSLSNLPFFSLIMVGSSNISLLDNGLGSKRRALRSSYPSTYMNITDFVDPVYKKDTFLSIIKPVAIDWHHDSKRFVIAEKGNSLCQKFKTEAQKLPWASRANYRLVHAHERRFRNKDFQEDILSFWRKKMQKSKYLSGGFCLFDFEAEQKALRFSYI